MLLTVSNNVSGTYVSGCHVCVLPVLSTLSSVLHLVPQMTITRSCHDWQLAWTFVVFCLGRAACDMYRCLLVQVGWGGYLNTHEKYFYCLDALPIFVAFCIYSVLHFGKYLDAPLALRLPETTKRIIVNDSSSSVKAPAGTTASSKATVPSQGQKNMAVSTLV